MIEMVGAEGSRVAGELAERADVGTVVHLAVLEISMFRNRPSKAYLQHRQTIPSQVY